MMVMYIFEKVLYNKMARDLSYQSQKMVFISFCFSFLFLFLCALLVCFIVVSYLLHKLVFRPGVHTILSSLFTRPHKRGMI